LGSGTKPKTCREDIREITLNALSKISDGFGHDGVDPIIGSDHIHNKVVEAVQGFTRKEKHTSQND
jgi:hypothetical protein